ncbi:anti-sigma factor family protein [Azospirillum sp. sgz301742]
MDCRETRHLIDAGIDGELDLTTQLAVEAHLAGCDACRAADTGRRALVHRVRAGAETFAAPDALRRRLLASLPGAEPEKAEPERAGPPPVPWNRSWSLSWSWAWLTGGLSLASAALAMGLTLAVVLPGRGDGPVPELVAAHVRSLMADHLTDVASSDRHTVKPWFNGRIDVSPPVPDLAEHGFPLVGGRLDYVAERPVAALVYRRGRHVINLFVRADPAAEAGTPSLAERHGYNLLRWSQPGLVVWAVSDLNREELESFARLWSSAAAP